MSCFAFLMILFSSVLMSCLWSPPSLVIVHPSLIGFLVNLPTLLYKSVYVSLCLCQFVVYAGSSVFLLDSLFVFLSLASTLLHSFMFFDPCLPLLPPYISFSFISVSVIRLDTIMPSEWKQLVYSQWHSQSSFYATKKMKTFYSFLGFFCLHKGNSAPGHMECVICKEWKNHCSILLVAILPAFKNRQYNVSVDAPIGEKKG